MNHHSSSPLLFKKQSILSPEPENANKVILCPPQPTPALSSSSTTTTTSRGSSNSSPATTSKSTSLFASLFQSSAPAATDLIGPDAAVMEPPLLCLSSFFPLAPERRQSQPSPHLSATALLQKAAQMGSTSSSSSFLRSLGLATSSTDIAGGDVSGDPLRWSQQQQRAPFGLGLGLATANLPELMMGSSPLFGPKPATLDFLGLGMSPAFMNSMGGGVTGVGSSLPEKTWEAAEQKPDCSTFP